MSPTTLSPPMTADEFAATDHKGFELVQGQLVELSVSNTTANTATEVLFYGIQFTKPRNLGAWFSSEGGVRCFPDDPDRVRKPDAFFVSRERLPGDTWSTAFVSIPPDLAVEVVSPNDLAYEVQGKVRESLEAGVTVVWVIYPETRTAFIHRAGRGVEIFENEELEAEPVLPGFRCKLAAVLPAPSK